MSMLHTPLNAMQKAYLLGKSKMFPLSQSSMHDFREFHGQIAKSQFDQALQALVARYPALRTKINETELTQVVQDQIDLAQQVEYIDLQHCAQHDVQQQLQHWRNTFTHYLHALDTPPWRMAFIQLPADTEYRTVIFASFDGLILDGYSISAFLSELFDQENDGHRELESTPHPTPKSSEVQASAKDRQFWCDKLDRIEQITQLPWRTALEKITAPHYQRRGISIQREGWKQLCNLAAKQRLLPNALLTSIILEVLSKWTEDQNLVLSVPISNSAMTGGVANHSSFIVLHYMHTAQQSVVETARAVQKDILESMAHSSFSGVDISKYLIQKTKESIVLPIALTNGLAWKPPVKNQQIQYVAGQTQTPQLALDIRLTLSAAADLMIDFDYVEEALSEQIIQDMLQALQQRLEQLAALPDLQDAPVQTSSVTELGEDWQEEAEDDLQLDNYLAQIEQQLFQHTSDKAALIYADQKISYQHMREQVAKVGFALKQAGVTEKQVVAICLKKSPEHIYAMLGCALSNIIWLPVDMDSPQARRDYILHNSRVDLVISDTPVEGLKYIDIHAALQISVCPTQTWQYEHDRSPAYYLYTSGSTGTPKCVVLNNQATSNILQQSILAWDIQHHDIHLAATPFHHDMSLFDILVPLSVGGTLVIPTAEQAKSAVAWAQLIETYKVSIWCTVPAMADMLLTAAEPRQLQSIRLINQGGDYVKPSVVQKFRQILPHARLISIGGPTETTILSIWYEITPQDQDIIPYGKALKHNEYHVLNSQGEFCPVGVVGQMYMTGVNLSNGYLLDGHVLQKDFVLLTLANGEQKRAFRMSDKGYVRTDGNIIFAGRDEGYLKVRGVRIAASEVENALLKHAEITDSVVMTCINPVFEGNELVAIYTTAHPQAGHFDPAQLRQFLQSFVPNSHIPSRWLYLNELPMTRNGKVDRKALKKTAQETLYQTYVPAPQAAVASPQSQLEHDILKLLRQSLPEQQRTAKLLMDTEILAVGMTPSYLNRLAKHCTQQFNTPIDFYRLASCKTIQQMVDNIKNQVNQKTG
ncbi:MAG: AMP-binding protein [Acinetobacter sp.]